MEYLKEYVKEIEVQYEMSNGNILKSKIDSLDVNDHILNLCSLMGKYSESERTKGHFEIYYVGFRIFAGDGPAFSKESIQAIAKLEASIGQDIYCNCSSDEGDDA
ncbi:MAG: hypothetical protein GY705_20070, partial [Bacteroidetes bacterium]|nr:hypothetical protein [Bacteroidota bacterium]